MKQIIHVENLYTNYFVIAFYREITYLANTLKSIIICSGFYKDFAPRNYNYKGDFLDTFWGTVRGLGHRLRPEGGRSDIWETEEGRGRKES